MIDFHTPNFFLETFFKLKNFLKSLLSYNSKTHKGIKNFEVPGRNRIYCYLGILNNEMNKLI